MSNVPKLRFPGFDGEWERGFISEVSDINPGNDGLPEQFQYIDLEIVVSGNITKTNIIKRQNAPSRAQRLLAPDDILFQAVRPYQQNNYLFKGNTKPVVASTGYIQMRVSETPLFMYQLIHTNRFLQQVLVRCTGTSYPAINSNDFATIRINYPGKNEQTKIADFLSLIGKKITKQDEKVAALEQYKKWLMQKIFAREIRFKDDNGKDYPVWEKKSLSQVSYCLDSLRKPMNSAERALIKGNVPYYGANGIQGYINKYIFDEDLVLIAEDGGSFESFRDKPIAQFVTGKSWVNNHAHVLRAKGNSRFLFYSLVHKDIRKYICGTSRSKLTKENMIKILVPSPTIPEQTKIANLLSLYDRKIEKEKTKLEVLREQKKGLLQQMFV